MLNIANDLTIIRRNGGITSGLNVILNAGTDLSVGGDLSIATDISNLTSGANISVLAGRNLTIGGSLALLTSAAAQSGSGANGQNVTLSVGNDLVAHNEGNSGGVDLEIITPSQQTGNSGANLALNVGHNLTTDPGGDTTLLVNNNMSHVVDGAKILGAIGGNLQTNNLTIQLLNNGGEIDTGGNVSLEVSGNITAQGDATFEIQNQGGTMGQNAPIGGSRSKH